MDHYTVLGLSRTANKEEIKEAFRKLAMQFHPDKHSQSPKSVRDGATRRFKQVSEAYEVLIDDRKRADYNLLRNSGGGGGRSATASGGGGYSHRGYGYGHYNNNRHKHSYRRSASASGFASDGVVSKFEIALRFLSTRVFLLNVAFAGALLGGSVIIDTSREALWKMHNPGKSFEDAMESIEKAKALKDEM